MKLEKLQLKVGDRIQVTPRIFRGPWISTIKRVTKKYAFGDIPGNKSGVEMKFSIEYWSDGSVRLIGSDKWDDTKYTKIN